MESAFGADFGDVRIHVGPQAQALGATSFTHGSHIHFAPGQYDPHTPQGQRMLGRELAHVVQQRTMRVRNPFGSGIAVVHDAALEAEAERLGARAVQAAPAVHAAPLPVRTSSARTVQPYWVLGAWKIYKEMPYFSRVGYPYAVVGNASLAAQQRPPKKKGETDHADDFLLNDSKTAADVRVGTGVSLRVSDDGNMAIEDSDLKTRQPKVFYATNTIFNASNIALAKVKSRFRLQKTGKQITIGFWFSTKVLAEITVDYLTKQGDVGNVDDAPQNCNEIAGQVIGKDANFLARSDAPLETAARVVGLHDEYLASLKKDDDVQQALREKIYKLYVGAWDYGPVHREQANEFARPGVGRAYMIATLAEAKPLDKKSAEYYDLRTKKTIRADWSYHFGGVVAESGTDRITLENYARGDNRGANADPRWFFQMYGEGSGQSFHEVHNATGGYANAITIQAKKRSR